MPPASTSRPSSPPRPSSPSKEESETFPERELVLGQKRLGNHQIKRFSIGSVCVCVCVCYAYGASDRPASFHFLSQLPETPLISSKNQGGVILGFFLTTTPMTMSSTVTSCSTLRKCELLPGGRSYFARCTHIVSFTPGKPWPSQATPRPRVDCYCHDWPAKQSATAG